MSNHYPIPEEYRCSICLHVMMYPVTTACKHSFCSSCLFDWLLRAATCPHCRSFLRPGMVRNDPQQDNKICHLLSGLDDRQKEILYEVDEIDVDVISITKTASDEEFDEILEDFLGDIDDYYDLDETYTDSEDYDNEEMLDDEEMEFDYIESEDDSFINAYWLSQLEFDMHMRDLPDQDSIIDEYSSEFEESSLTSSFYDSMSSFAVADTYF